MPESKTIEYQKSDYPDLAEHDGQEVEFTGSARIEVDGETIRMTIEDIDFKTETKADKSLKSLKDQKDSDSDMEDYHGDIKEF
jgi:hypothetical protein